MNHQHTDMSPPPSERPRVRRQTSRGRNGCYTCRKRRVKCDEVHPVCSPCRRLHRDCDWAIPPSARQQEKQKAQQWRKSPPVPLLPAGDTNLTVMVMDGHDEATGSSSSVGDEDETIELMPAHEENTQSAMFIPDLDPLSVQIGNLTFPLPGEDLVEFYTSPAWTSPFPTIDVMMGSAAMFASLPTEAPLTSEDRQALSFYDADKFFGFGSKSPSWSTHALLRKMATSSATLFYLLLAAASSELGHSWETNRGSMLDNAERNYKMGRQWLARTLSPDSDPLEVMASFWFLYINQRRRPAKLRIAYTALSSLMTEYINQSGLVKILVSTNNDGASQSASGPNYSPKKKALLARLTTWLFWVDTQACFQGEGGTMARVLAQSISTKGVLAMFDISTEALKLNWDTYPRDELVDDMINKSSLKLLHHTWILFQEVNEAVDATTPLLFLDHACGVKIKAKIEALRQKSSITPVFSMTESKDRVRDRLLANSDWAVANFYSLMIYHFRSGIRTEEVEEIVHVPPFHSEEGISGTVDALMVLIQKSLATPDKGQTDRMQWPLFWAGIEADTQFARDWVSERLLSPGLQSALQIVLLEQSDVGGRIGMRRIREICKMTCSDADSGLVDMGIWAA